jgi:hypothetical protein
MTMMVDIPSAFTDNGNIADSADIADIADSADSADIADIADSADITDIADIANIVFTPSLRSDGLRLQRFHNLPPGGGGRGLLRMRAPAGPL